MSEAGANERARDDCLSATAMNRISSMLKGIWAFCSYLFVPRWK